MHSWTGRGSRSLFCMLRSFARPAERQFTTTPTLHRSQRARAKKAAREKEAASSPEKAARAPKKPSAPGRATRQGIAAARDFGHVVEAALCDVQYKLHATGAALEGWQRFKRQIMNAVSVDVSKSGAKWTPLQTMKMTIQKAYLKSGAHGLREELEFMLYADYLTGKHSIPNLKGQLKVVDMRYPAEWYPRARSIQRTIHLHVGPTNSGKTYHALKRLQECKNGFYAGPLRLLAQEVYHRFQDTGPPCSLVTGDEVRLPTDGQLPRVVSNTVEMVSLGDEYDVGVIDEIQMIADPVRGWAWTRAVLGAQAAELHLCGETRAVPLIRELCALTGDNLEIHRYERLNPLEVMPHSLRGNLNNLQKGDCLVAFSRVGIHALKADIEKTTGRRAAIVYGGLPAEIRTQQANLFNDPNNDYDFLVASDAIGMGLNLRCKRVIFETLIKRMPTGLQRLSVPEIKQIGGRAGRYRPVDGKGNEAENDNVGFVTSLEEVDLPFIQQAMGTEPPPLRAAGVFPPGFMFEKFSAYFPQSAPFEYLIKRLLEIVEIHPLFFLCEAKDQLVTSEIIDAVEGLSMQDKLTFMGAPMDTRAMLEREIACAYAECISSNTRGRLLDIPLLNLEILQEPVSGNKEYVQQLESLHKAIILYSWLSFRFGGVFTDRTLAAHVKELVEERMIRALTEFSSNKKLRKDASLKRQIALQKQLRDQQRILPDANLNQHSEEGGTLGGDFAEATSSDSVEPTEATESTESSSALEDMPDLEESAPPPQR
ncbi:ATP-dependent RNA helicase DHX8 [Penicillium hispanicum]|uniref:ATP-dependent RNA helicase DHX8 n=1 Tax=Penicillium hispanicum TaxID=1080232 RepID=UPI0025411ADF|nr:ATP-dependent RNA helicase DHX8 [Penicillium hispanicum]KAJ5587538.1 ATP-dependent RNA helicase DHX8 [Penicillium hispanicum]